LVVDVMVSEGFASGMAGVAPVEGVAAVEGVAGVAGWAGEAGVAWAIAPAANMAAIKAASNFFMKSGSWS
jgi:hypothetical protein